VNQPNKCIDITGGSLIQGTKLEIWDCNGITNNQNFVYHQDTHTLMAAGANNLCVDLGKMHDGSPAMLWPCNGQKQQTLVYHSDTKHFTNANGDCLDLQNSDTTNGKTIQTWRCNGASGQKWAAPSSEESETVIQV
jgi:hypothetical protein